MANPVHPPETVIIGAGLSGLTAAVLLGEGGHRVRVVEARSAPGGRIRSVVTPDGGEYLADLGPTWIWPMYQPTVQRWIDKLGLETFDQFVEGDAILDYGPGSTPAQRALPHQLGNVRPVGGPQAIVDSLASLLPAGALRADATVRSVTPHIDRLTLGFDQPETPTIDCSRLVVAVPPRIALSTIDWKSTLPDDLMAALGGTPTWMAPQAKVVALYPSPFWRERGLSGRILSQAGPLVEAHDHSGPDGSPAAIFGFVGWPLDVRASASPSLESHVRDQLQRCFGPDSPAPLSIHIEDWATDTRVTTPPDLSEPMMHPAVAPEVLRQAHVDHRVWFAAAETAERSPGLIEGALDAAERVARAIDDSGKGGPGPAAS